MSRTIPALCILLAACTPEPDGGPGVPLDEGEPMLVLDRGLVDFGTVDLADSPLYELVSVQNTGDATLYIYELTLEDEDAPFELDVLGQPMVEPQQWINLEITLLAQELGEQRTSVQIDSNDPFGVRSFLLRADADGGELTLSPEEQDLGAVGLGCPVSTDVRVSNSGSAPLTVSGIELEGGWDEFSMPEPQLPFTLEPIDYQDFTVTLTPTGEGLPSVTFVVTSDDPISPERSATIHGATLDNEWADETFLVPVGPSADLIIAVDKSGNMQEHLEPFSAAFGSFYETLLETNIDFQLAVTQADDGCINGSRVWIDNSFTSSEAEATLETMFNWGGSAASNTERAFMLLEAALAETGSGGCNEGLVREEANLHLMGISDEPEQSVNSWPYYLKLFQDYDSNVTMHAIGGPVPDGCTSATGYTNIDEAVSATGGMFMSICEKDWSDGLDELALYHLNSLGSFRLADPAVEDTISVRIDAISTTAFRYESAWQAVVLDDSITLLGGEEVEIRYAVQPSCL